MTRRAYDVAALEELARRQAAHARRHARRARDRRAAVAAVPRAAAADRSRRPARSQPGMPVITGTGPVGRIDKVYGDYADVMLISDPRSRIDVVIQRTGGARHPDRARPRRLVRVHDRVARASREPSREIARAGRRRGRDRRASAASFPPGLVVGKVTQASTATTACSRASRSRPTVDVSRVRAVMVLLAPPPPPDPDAQDASGAASPRSGRGR